MTGDTIVDAVINEGGFSVSDTGIARTTVTAWCHAAYIEMVTRSRWALSIASLGTTAADTSEYSLSDSIIDIYEVKVGATGAPLPRVGVEDIWSLLASGTTLVAPTTMVYAGTFSSAGDGKLYLYPAPDTAGDTIYGLVASLPSAFTDSSGFAPSIPEDFHRALVWGALAEGYGVGEETLDQADYWRNRFETKIEELRRRKNSRVGQNTVLSIRRR